MNTSEVSAFDPYSPHATTRPSDATESQLAMLRTSHDTNQKSGQENSPFHDSEDCLSLRNVEAAGTEEANDSQNISEIHERVGEGILANLQLLEDHELDDNYEQNVTELQKIVESRSSLITTHTIFDMKVTIDSLISHTETIDLNMSQKHALRALLKCLQQEADKIEQEKLKDSLGLMRKYKSSFEFLSRKANDGIRRQLEEASKQLEDALAKLETANASCAAIQTQLVSAQALKICFEEERNQALTNNTLLEKQISELRAEQKSLEREKIRLESDKEGLAVALEQAKELAVGLNKKVLESEQENQKYSSVHASLNQEYSKLKSTLQEVEGENNSLKNQQEELRSTIRQLDLSVQDYKTKIAVLDNDLSHSKESHGITQSAKNGFEAELNAFQKQVRELEQERAQLLAGLQGESKSHEEYKKKFDQLQEQFLVKTEQLLTLQSTIREIQENEKRLLSHCQQLEQSSTQLQKDKSTYQKKVRELEETTKELTEFKDHYSREEFSLSVREEKTRHADAECLKKLAQANEINERAIRHQDLLQAEENKLKRERYELEELVKNTTTSINEGKRAHILEEYKSQIVQLTHDYQQEKEKVTNLWENLREERRCCSSKHKKSSRRRQ